MAKENVCYGRCLEAVQKPRDSGGEDLRWPQIESNRVTRFMNRHSHFQNTAHQNTITGVTIFFY